MPSFEKSPPELIARFDEVAGQFGQAQRRKMFGYPALFVGGNLATGLFADAWMVRLAPADLEALLALPGAAPFSPMPGRTMTGYATLPPEMINDNEAVDAWISQAIAFAASLPAKR